MEHESDMCFNADCFKDECDANTVEAIFDEASQKLHDMLKADVQETIAQYKTAQKEQAVLEKDIALLKSQKRYLEQQVSEAFRKAEDAESNDISTKYINKIVKKYTGFYAPGDEVWNIEVEYKQNTCSLCRGRGKIDATFTEEGTFGEQMKGHTAKFECPRCRGNGMIKKPFYFVKKSKVMDVELRLKFTKSSVNPRNFVTETLLLDDKIYRVKPDSIYKTEAAALIRAKEMNDQTDKNWDLIDKNNKETET